MSEPNSLKSTEQQTANQAEQNPKQLHATGTGTPVRHVVVPGYPILLWMTYLLLASVVSLFMPQPIYADSSFFEAAVRQVYVFIIFGQLILWPMLCLSRKWQHRAALSLAAEALTMMVLAQVVIWPLYNVTRWPLQSIINIDFFLLACTVGVVGITALGVTVPGKTPRVLAMLACIVLVFFGPLLGMLRVFLALPLPRLADSLSPVLCVYRETSRVQDNPSPGSGFLTVVVAFGVLCWIIAFALESRSRR